MQLFVRAHGVEENQPMTVLVLFRVSRLWGGVGDLTTLASLYSHYFFGLMTGIAPGVSK